VTPGIGNHPLSVMRFIPQRVVIHVGDTVTFTDHDPMDADPHTVNYVIDTGSPSGDAQHFAGGALSSGPLGFMRYDRSRSFKVTFTRAGI
jgi:plastocyanin